MQKLLRLAPVLLGLLCPLGSAATPLSSPCGPALTRRIPSRTAAALGGTALVDRLAPLDGAARDREVLAELLLGNVPSFVRRLQPVTLLAGLGGSRITLCVAPDYLALGSDDDYLLVPLGLPSALELAARLGFLLPTRKIVDAIYDQAAVRLTPQPLPASSAMRSTAVLLQHDQLVREQREERGAPLGALTSGHKKDLVLTPLLWNRPGRVAIYGWHRSLGDPIQPLSTVHGAAYADYSHGVRLVSEQAWVDGTPRSLLSLLADPSSAAALSDEGALPRLGEWFTAGGQAATGSSGTPGDSSRGSWDPAPASRARTEPASGTSPGAPGPGRTRTSSPSSR
jgi:hypothetical protein